MRAGASAVRRLARCYRVITAAAVVAVVLSAALSNESEVREEPILYCVQSFSRPVHARPVELAVVCDGGGNPGTTSSSSATSTTEGGGGGGGNSTTTTTTTTTPQPTTTTTTDPDRPTTTTTKGTTGTTSPGGGGGGGTSTTAPGSSDGGGTGGETASTGGSAQDGAQAGGSGDSGRSGEGSAVGGSDGAERPRSVDSERVARGRNASVAVVPGVPALPADSVRTGLVAWSLGHGLAALYLLLRRVQTLLLFPWLRRRDRKDEERTADSSAG